MVDILEAFQVDGHRRTGRLPAISKVVRVRVLGSKKRLTMVLPRSSGTFLISRLPKLTNDSAVSRMPSRVSRGRPLVVRKCFQFFPFGQIEWRFEWRCRWASLRGGSGSGADFDYIERKPAIRIAEFGLLVAAQVEGLPDHIGLYRQLPAGAFEQHRQADPFGAAKGEKFR